MPRQTPTQKVYYDKRRKDGRCMDCGCFVVGNFARCITHREKQAAEYRERYRLRGRPDRPRAVAAS